MTDSGGIIKQFQPGREVGGRRGKNTHEEDINHSCDGYSCFWSRNETVKLLGDERLDQSKAAVDKLHSGQIKNVRQGFYVIGRLRGL